MIKTDKDLRQKIASCTECLKAKFDGSNGKRAIIVCGPVPTTPVSIPYIARNDSSL